MRRVVLRHHHREAIVVDRGEPLAIERLGLARARQRLRAPHPVGADDRHQLGEILRRERIHRERLLRPHVLQHHPVDRRVAHRVHLVIEQRDVLRLDRIVDERARPRLEAHAHVAVRHHHVGEQLHRRVLDVLGLDVGLALERLVREVAVGQVVVCAHRLVAARHELGEVDQLAAQLGRAVLGDLELADLVELGRECLAGLVEAAQRLDLRVDQPPREREQGRPRALDVDRGRRHDIGDAVALLDLLERRLHVVDLDERPALERRDLARLGQQRERQPRGHERERIGGLGRQRLHLRVGGEQLVLRDRQHHAPVLAGGAVVLELLLPEIDRELLEPGLLRRGQLRVDLRGVLDVRGRQHRAGRLL